MKNILKSTISTSFGLAGMGIGLGILGEEFNSSGLKSAGSTAVKFVPTAINIGMGAMVIDMAKDLKTKKSII